MQDTVSEKVAAKAQRLISEGKVSRVKGHVYTVQGDSASYTVMVGYPQEVSGSCDCPAQGTCSHLIAACAYDLPNALVIYDPEDLTQPRRPVKSDPFEGII